MDHAITVGMVVWTSLAVIGVIGVLGIFILVLSIIASGFDH